MNQPRHSLIGLLCRVILTCVALASLAACATPAEPERMAVTRTPDSAVFPALLQHAMCVRSVTGGEDTNPLWVSKVGNADFRQALTTSLGDADLLSPPDTCKYPIDVNLLGLSQPAVGFALEVTSHANYKVYNGAGAPVLLATISAAYTAQFSEAFAAIVRLKRANEGSIRESIKQFMDRLRQVQLASPGAETPVARLESDIVRNLTRLMETVNRHRDSVEAASGRFG